MLNPRHKVKEERNKMLQLSKSNANLKQTSFLYNLQGDKQPASDLSNFISKKYVSKTD